MTFDLTNILSFGFTSVLILYYLHSFIPGLVEHYRNRWFPNHALWQPVWYLSTGGAIVSLIIAVGLGLHLAWSLLPTLVLQMFVANLIGITILDLKFKVIPDRLQIIGFLTASVIAWSTLNGSHILTNVIWGVGLALTLGLLGFLYEKKTGKEPLGWGDLKLIAAISPLLGAELIPMLTLACLFAMVPTIIQFIRTKKSSSFAFGPYLGLASLVLICF